MKALPQLSKRQHNKKGGVHAKMRQKQESRRTEGQDWLTDRRMRGQKQFVNDSRATEQGGRRSCVGDGCE